MYYVIKHPKCDVYQDKLASMVNKSFDKKFSRGAVKSGIMPNQELTKEVHKPIIRKFENRKKET